MASAKGKTSLAKGIASLLLNPEYSDLEIKVGSKQWPLNKAVVCTQSKVFKKMCEKDWKEGKTGVITLEDDDELVIEQLIRYLYTSGYTDVIPISDKGDAQFGPMHFNVLMFIAADKYDMAELGTTAVAKFTKRLKDFASKHDFLLSVEEVFKNGPASATDICDKVIQAAVTHSYALVNEPVDHPDDGREHATFQDLLRDIPAFGEKVISGITTLAAYQKKDLYVTEKLHCDTCATDFSVSVINKSDRKATTCPFCKAPARLVN